MGDGDIHVNETELEQPTLIKGLSGVGLVGKIPADHQVTTFDMPYYASVRCEGIPQKSDGNHLSRVLADVRDRRNTAVPAAQGTCDPVARTHERTNEIHSHCLQRKKHRERGGPWCVAVCSRRTDRTGSVDCRTAIDIEGLTAAHTDTYV